MFVCFTVMESSQQEKICLITNLRRKYFDSGDFALSHAYRVSDIGQIQTGREHPLRKGISHPSSPVPASSNINKNSGEQEKGVKEGNKATETSHLHLYVSADKE
ncbi:hypothetical protein DPSP01_013743 [Paraphaeosphaeria sporulosa]